MQSLDLEIGIADSRLESYSRTGGELLVTIRAWNERLVKFLFRDVIFVRDRCAGEFADVICGGAADDEALLMGLAVAYETPPAVHSYSVYAFTNPDDLRTLEVVATGHSVSYE